MKKISIKILLVSAFAFVISSCGEDFLETQPTEFISADRVAEISEINPGLQLSNLQGIYASMYTTGTGGTDLDHDDFGQKGYDIYSDFLSGDLVLGAQIYGWYSQFSQYLITVDYTQTDNYQVWRYYYRIIFGANLVIDGLGGEEVVPETIEGKQIMGQAKAMRAYGYFYLAQFLDENYEPNSPLIPIYRNTQVPNQPLSPTSDVYDLIVSDLTDAITLLDGFQRPGKFAVNQDVAKGLLAYTFAAMGENAKAAEQAKSVIDGGAYSIKTNAPDGPDNAFTDITDGFNDVSDPSWMWGTDITADMGIGLVSWWGQMDYFSYSYAAVGDYKSINYDLYESIPEDDYRKGQFAAFSDNDYVAINKFYDPRRVVFGATRTVTTDLVYMRIEELYLLHAESAAKDGDEPSAKMSLKAVMENRIPDASYIDALSGQSLLEEIFLQTRIEFFGEGKSYLLKKRNEIDVVLGPNHINDPGKVIPINSDEMSTEIPQLEIQNNPEISLSDVQ